MTVTVNHHTYVVQSEAESMALYVRWLLRSL